MMLSAPKSLSGPRLAAYNHVQLGLGIGTHVPHFVDAATGKTALHLQAAMKAGAPVPLDRLESTAENLVHQLEGIRVPRHFLHLQRSIWLLEHARALRANVQILQGKHFSVADEAKLLYGVDVAPFPDLHFQDLRNRLHDLLPGKNDRSKTLAERRAECDQARSIDPNLALRLIHKTIYPKVQKLSAAFYTAPEKNSVEFALAHGVSWTGYNWWQGKGHSLVQFNGDRPMALAHLADTVMHEAGLGHHLHHVGIEHYLDRGHRWLEHSIDLFGVPWGTVAEGIAMTALPLVMDKETWIAWHKDVLFPAAHMTHLDAEREYEQAVTALKTAYGNAVFLFADGASAEQVQNFFRTNAASTEADALKSANFVKKYGSYAFTYYMGAALMAKLYARPSWNGQPSPHYWYHRLVSQPVTPSMIRAWIEHGSSADLSALLRA
ncbi:MAG: hypothetical protein COX62_02510 [Deltaproteobacteria bacterium CG_4_10_14_0_2_um_filter_43_8]|nr:MAG: hypothetical protein COV43_00455 [Deltaproteobacteria bacterium CG11_big_fil_rev_8_21_14_0_20_42_23]PJA21416.1 MAG: hypothetical protein COX62_02510 [Deltaproteobacteria bacterium CG_4_10_14_0_2_um_filter_43_8]PJC64694.1 MAG: hypothetical protein CO021_02915 [Deltaproteobacteria bacterium CG_4_9_14_0_2_um_filter_42_21]